MKITIESTTKIVDLNGVPARVWEGETESGIKCHCYVTRIACQATDERGNIEFMKELKEQRTPSKEIEAIPVECLKRRRFRTASVSTDTTEN